MNATTRALARLSGIALAASAVLIGGSLTSGAASPSATIDEKTTSGTNKFAYTGTWVDCGGCNTGAYQNSFKYSATTGSTVTFTFTGTQAILYGYTEPQGGIAGISVDGGTSADVNLYAATQAAGPVFSTPALTSGVHTVTMTVTGRTTGTSRTITIDKAEVYTGSAPATSSTGAATTTTSPTAPSTSTTPASTTSAPASSSTAATSAPAATTVLIDEKTTSGTNKFAYTGTWVDCGGCNTGAYQNSFKYSATTGSTATLTFTGTAASLVGYREPQGGIAGISVDGGSSADVNLYAATRSLGPIFTTPALAAGTHTVTMTVTGRTTGTSRTITIDRADLTTGGSPSTATATPPSTTTPPSSTPPSTGGGMASLTFDDSQLGQYQNARPVLRAAGINGTFYVISDSFGWSGHMTPAQAKTLAAEGDELGNHTRDHSDLTTLSSAAVGQEFADAQAAIAASTGVTPTTCAYPYGTSNTAVQAEAAKYFAGCRGTSAGQNAASSLTPYNLRVVYIQTGTTASQVRAAADQAKASSSWVIFVYHGVGTVGSSDDVTPATFSAQVDALRAAGIPVRTVRSALAALGR